MKHTKGPWFIDDESWIRSEETAETVLIPETYKSADLILIATAPEMLEALEMALETIKTDFQPRSRVDVIQGLQLTIAKARGES